MSCALVTCRHRGQEYRVSFSADGRAESVEVKVWMIRGCHWRRVWSCYIGPLQSSTAKRAIEAAAELRGERRL